MEIDSTAEAPASVYGDTDVLEIGEEDFKVLLDVPFMTVNRDGSAIEGEVILSGDPVIDEARIQTVIDIGHAHGVHAYARKHGDGDHLLIFFTADTALHE
ncbi:MAG TPA: hypothetical protein VF867_06080 [Arthrobacter sp.]